VLDALFHQLPERQFIYTEERCHQVIFDHEYFSALTKNALRTIIISNWSAGQIKEDCFKDASFIKISAHTQVRDEYEEPLYENYQLVMNEITNLSGPGVLVLVGAGLIGKIFIDCARSNGAVALDVGSVFDYLAGRKTRSIADRL
jgi:hypothetical protein